MALLCCTRSSSLLLQLSLLLLLPYYSQAWVTTTAAPSLHSTSQNRIQRSSSTSTSLSAVPAAASLLAGSVAGALGVGVAYPLDTIKTKAQVMATTQAASSARAAASLPTAAAAAADGSATLALALPSSSAAAAAVAVPPVDTSMWQMAVHIYQTAGWAGFFGGVQTSMMGQAVIKAVVFAVNAAALHYAQDQHWWHDDTTAQLLTAAATAGFLSAFLAAPVDRIKVLLQAAAPVAATDAASSSEPQQQQQQSDKDCLQHVLRQEGWQGLLGRGLGCTMLREVPAYTLYFGVYGSLMACDSLTQMVGGADSWLAPALFGAAAGCACWIPIYPIDVVKTIVQNTVQEEQQQANAVDGVVVTDSSSSTANNNKSSWQVAVDLYQTAGPGIFWDGLSPRLLRQAVNHAVTFSVYNALMHSAVLSS